MHDLAHICLACRTITIFGSEAAYPRRCGSCDEIVREAPSSGRFLARPVFDEDDDDAERLTLELGPSSMECAPF
jgi:hypothetical protein